jgi:two-component system, LytTR family, response regulator
MKVVLIDDESMNLLVLRRLLAEIDPTITILAAFTESKDVLLHVKDLKPDVVFTNIEMADGSIFELLEAMQPYTFDVIFVTAKSQFEFLLRAMRMGAFDYIVKPVDREDLHLAINRWREKQGRSVY